MKKILIDSDVILDVYLNREPFVKYSKLILRHCELSKYDGYITPITYSNLYYILRKLASHQKVIKELKDLFKITSVLNMDQSVVENALNSNLKDFEDALQNYSTQNVSEIKYVITRNTKDYKKSDLIIFSPESFIKSKKRD